MSAGLWFQRKENVVAWLAFKTIAGCIHCGLLLESVISTSSVVIAGFATHSLFNADFHIPSCENPVEMDGWVVHHAVIRDGRQI
jgi:hypothetical protein